ncbi:XRE family transcriptional regulator [Lactobacillus johnsonii]|uniref:helix-turn-helix domain-containing protein n=1 Tax=Lactobacillus johnsonii TaxID=33959 RepID=UPI000BEEB1BD|nr:helix-turn-helix domain-containing protein [Lactobacillus johnsonii]PEG68181.1 XRE family transcriptional regulator [Lactobacillus johnsonii]
MEFNEQIKRLRKENNLTQEEMAKKLNVTRQAISNWENNRNLPDFEMIILIAETFDFSLDELILEDKKMNKIEQILINDGKRTRAKKFNMVTTIIGSVFIILEIIFFLISAISVSYIDRSGVLHENFFLVPLGYLSLFVGILIIIAWVINSIRLAIKERKNN